MGRPAYLGQVTTRVNIPNTFNSTLKSANGRRAHYARDTMNSFQIVIPNFYVIAGTGESGTGAAATVTASIEYPIGTRTQVKFSGIAAGSIPNNSYLISDAIGVSIPKDALFYVWLHWENTSGFIYSSYTGNHPGVFQSEGYQYSASILPDVTMSGTITNTSPTNTNTFGCCAIIAKTRRPSVYLLGDSRQHGTQDDNSTSGDLGEIAKSIGPYLAYGNYGISSTKMSVWNSSHANQLALSVYYTSVALQMGINDIYGGATAITVLAARLTALALFPGKKVVESTLPPETTSTDGWATTINQAQVSAPANAQRVLFNNAVRAGGRGFNGYLEIADVVESARDSGLWVPGYTTDGIHEVAAANLAIKAAGAIPISVFNR